MTKYRVKPRGQEHDDLGTLGPCKLCGFHMPNVAKMDGWPADKVLASGYLEGDMWNTASVHAQVCRRCVRTLAFMMAQDPASPVHAAVAAAIKEHPPLVSS